MKKIIIFFIAFITLMLSGSAYAGNKSRVPPNKQYEYYGVPKEVSRDKDKDTASGSNSQQGYESPEISANDEEVLEETVAPRVIKVEQQ